METILIVLLLAPVWGSLIWFIWEGTIHPRLIQRSEIERLAGEALERDGPHAVYVLWLQEDHARRYSHAFEAGLLRRVRRETGGVSQATNPPTPPPA
jgi:hypothetical protein